MEIFTRIGGTYMRIGYACLTVGVPDTEQKSCVMRNASVDRLSELVSFNLKALEHIFDYNKKNDIRLFRISSDIIPFGSSPVNQLKWWELYQQEFQLLHDKIISNGARVSMHPGQYTVLNSLEESVVFRAIEDLNYHTRFLDALGVGPEHKIILHIGGVYNDKERSIERFMQNYNKLEEAVKQRLVIENDDRSYNILEVLSIGRQLKIPVVFDNLHNSVNPSGEEHPEVYWINECQTTWKMKDGPQKIHYSQQNPLKRAGSHSEKIQTNEFLAFCNRLGRDDLDIMLEVKDKNLSTVQCINCIDQNRVMK